MEKIPTRTLVVAAALRNSMGRLLLQCRPADKHHGGLWEFPGGKVESHEKPSLALCRELSEELDLSVRAEDFRLIGSAQTCDAATHPPIVILLYTTRKWAGDPRAMEGGSFGWFTLAEIAKLAKPPLDISLAQQLMDAQAD